MLKFSALEVTKNQILKTFRRWRQSKEPIREGNKSLRGKLGSQLLFESMENRRLLAGSLSIGDVSIEEGNSGTTEFEFTVTRSGDLSGELTVDFSTENVTAVSGSAVFSEHIVSTSADATASVFSADVDSDGDVDLLSAAYFDNTISWYENDGSGNFEKHDVTTSLFGAESVFAADVDGDGDTDVLAAARGDDSVTWYENDGNENFILHYIGTNVLNAREVSALDFDKDGDMDVLCAAPGNNSIYWYENDGEENFTSHELATGLGEVFSIYSEDIDSDGDLDVVSANAGDKRITWIENDGEQNFSVHTIDTGANVTQPRSISAGDFNNDGKIDVVAAISANGINDTIKWFENDGEENFTLHEISSTTDNSWSVYVIDFDVDGDLDVISGSAHSSFSPIFWHENDGSGNFTSHVVTTERASPRSVSAADFDGDGNLDVASASHDDDTIAWHEFGVDGDYVEQNGSIIFADGQAEATIAILVYGETEIEADETFNVNLSNVVGGSIEDGQGLGTILNDDSPSTEPEIELKDSFGVDSDAFVRFSTPVSQYRSGVDDSWYVRRGTADSLHFLDITNSGFVPLTLFEIQIHAPDVTADVQLTSSSTDDIVLAPGATQRIHLTYAPTLPTFDNQQAYDFIEATGIVIISDAANAPTLEVTLQGASTFASDINYDGSANFGDFGLFNSSFGLDSQSPNWDPTVDITADGFFNFDDLGQLNLEFGLTLITQDSLSSFASNADTEIAGNDGWQQVLNAIGDTPSEATSVSIEENGLSNPLFLSFGIDIPDIAVIEGIEVVLITTGSDDPVNGPAVSLTTNGSTPKRTPTFVSGSWSEGVITLGGPNDLWGASWIPADFSTPTFGVFIEIESGNDGGQYFVYTAEIKITYNDPSSNFGQSREFIDSSGFLTETVQPSAKTALLFDDRQDDVAAEKARLITPNPALAKGESFENRFKPSDYEAIFEFIGGGRIEAKSNLDWLFDIENDLLEGILDFPEIEEMTVRTSLKP